MNQTLDPYFVQCLEDKQFAQAISRLLDVYGSVKRIKTSADVTCLLGYCYFMQAEYRKQGLKLLALALAKNCDSYFLYLYEKGIREIKEQQGFSASLELARIYLRKYPRNQKVLCLLTELQILTGQYKAALISGQLLKDEAVKKYFSAFSYYFLGDDVEFQSNMREALRLKPLQICDVLEQSKKIVLIYSYENSEFLPNVSNALAFQINGAHFDAALAFRAYPIQVEKLFINASFRDNMAYWKEKIEQYDAVINVISCPETQATALMILKDLLADVDRQRIMNHPDGILKTSRVDTYTLCHDLAGVTFPRAEQLPASKETSLRFPLLVRPLGSSTGTGLKLCHKQSELDSYRENLDTELAFCEFHDFKSDDDYYRKHRVFILDKEIMPSHAVALSYWNVHDESRHEDMMHNEKLRAEEEKYLTDMYSILSSTHLQILKKMGEQFNLDYIGIDFAILDDERILIFEVNAGMRFVVDYFQDFPYLIGPVNKLIQRFQKMIDEKSSHD